MKTKYLTLIILFFSTTFICSQNMKEGFVLLETGKYPEAQFFFKNVLELYPKNKTARLCYGRAVGLNGDSEKALRLFTTLLTDFPKDFEIKLNYAESLLWNKNYIVAEKYYLKLIKEKKNNVPALLGYSNTLSQLNKYETALVYVNKALEINPGNTNAILSKKYIRLGLANDKLNTQEYGIAEIILQENFENFENDTETLMNLGTLYLVSNQLDNAKKTYELIGENPNKRLESLNGLCLTYHLNKNDKKALKLSENAIILLSDKTDEIIKKQTTERYVQALIWNKKYRQASKIIAVLLKEQPDQNWILALVATLDTYKSDFKSSLEYYTQVVVKDSTSFNGNLGKANSLKALGHYDAAYKSAAKSLTIKENQKDALYFIKDLDKHFTPFAETKAAYSFDSGDNKAYSYTINSEFSFSTKFKVLGHYNYRTTNNSVRDIKGSSHNVLAGISYQVKNNIVLKSRLGVTSSKAETNNFNQLLADASINIKPYKLQHLELAYKREIQDFNAELLNREIVQNTFLLNYSLNTNLKIGWFSQYYYTSQNDANTRNLLFTSLYYNILEKPFLKGGINYQIFYFKNQVPLIYFSPSKFNAVEIFINVIKEESIANSNQWFYELTAATGYQLIEDDEKQSTYRFQGNLGYKFSERSLLNLFGTGSNVATTTAAGFNFTEIGLRFKWFIVSNPLFKKQ
jgi:tetratricopeptide (TPR) repeat protein